MQKVAFLVMIAFLVVSCNQASKENNTSSESAEVEQIVSATIHELLATPADYDGKEVAVSGMVTHVCRHGGQKCFIVAEDGETQIRIVPGGDIDEFKIELEGSTVAFKGVFRRFYGVVWFNLIPHCAPSVLIKLESTRSVVVT